MLVRIYPVQDAGKLKRRIKRNCGKRRLQSRPLTLYLLSAKYTYKYSGSNCRTNNACHIRTHRMHKRNYPDWPRRYFCDTRAPSELPIRLPNQSED